MPRPAYPPPSLITESAALEALCARLRAEPFVTIDTEFMRERTYYPELCVVQLGGAAENAVVDAQAPGLDLGPLGALLRDETTLKVFHAARQDVEIFWKLAGLVPSPMFDTQVAAMVCGFGESASYESLVSKLAKAAVDKSSRFTDWAYRPLTERQLVYALDDVIHLRTVYVKLREQLEKTGRETWLEGDMAVLSDPAIYRLDPTESWRRVKLRNPKPRTLAALKAIAAWREVEAQKRDIPRGRILRDEALIELATHMPTTAAQLGRTRGLPGGFADGKWGAAVLEAIERVMAMPQDALPKPDIQPEPPGNLGSTVELLKVLLKYKAEKNGVAAKLLATTDELERIAAGQEQLSGWRQELFGADAEALRDGKLMLGLERGRVKIFPVG